MSGAFRSVSISVFNRYLDFVVGAGLDASRLLTIAGTTKPNSIDPDERIDFAIYQRLVQASVQISEDPSLPLRYPIETKLDTATIVGLIAETSSSLAQSLREVNRYAKLMMEIDIMSGIERHPIEIDGDKAYFLDMRPNPNTFPELTEIALGRLIFEVEAIFPGEPFANAVTVTHPKPDHGDLYEHYWKCPVQFEAERNAVEFDAAWLSREYEQANPYALALFSEKATELKSELEGRIDLRGKIEAELLPILHLGTTDIDAVASKLGMSRSTLYRHLKDEGFTFAEIHDDLRRRVAMDHLSARKVSIKETAYLVGFSEASSFNRAFKRWTGASPKAYLAAR